MAQSHRMDNDTGMIRYVPYLGRGFPVTGNFTTKSQSPPSAERQCRQRESSQSSGSLGFPAPFFLLYSIIINLPCGQFLIGLGFPIVTDRSSVPSLSSTAKECSGGAVMQYGTIQSIPALPCSSRVH